MIQSAPIVNFADSCFVDVDLTEIVTKPQDQVIIDIEKKPAISIWKAAETGNVEALSYFVQNKTHLLDERDPNTECTLLHLLISNVSNPIQPLKLLLEHGADATARNMYNIQAIHAIFLHCINPLETAQMLLLYDADPNARDGDGWTPLHYAARFCPLPGPVLKLLIDAGADIDATDVSRKSALFSLLANGDHSLTLDWLIHTIKANVKIKGDFLDRQTRRTKQGTLILQAAKYGRLSCLRIIVSSSTAMESLEPILTREELEEAIDLVRQQLLKVTTSEQIERLGLIIMILEDLIQKLFKSKKSSRQSLIKTRTNLLKRLLGVAITRTTVTAEK
ncbi:hypothetical protein G6F37_001867 [Rhizopus arrhizus]|nr:hypothetical protein G6F38_002025 [Rhizopus arrhizus]KAG1162744.1 hypothetical protein G6F37_001867 [Rhizopus arrhizus]